MDNDKLRRGKPTIWKKYGEANALLFANMLSTFSNHMLLDDTTHPDVNTRLRLAREMNLTDMRVLHGQTITMDESDITNLQKVLKSHSLKTASFCSFMAKAGAILAGASEEEIRNIGHFAKKLAHCGQIANDALQEDIDNDRRTLKPNAVGAIGVKESKKLFNATYNAAEDALSVFENPNPELRNFLHGVKATFEKKISRSGSLINHKSNGVMQLAK